MIALTVNTDWSIINRGCASGQYTYYWYDVTQE